MHNNWRTIIMTGPICSASVCLCLGEMGVGGGGGVGAGVASMPTHAHQGK